MGAMNDFKEASKDSSGGLPSLKENLSGIDRRSFLKAGLGGAALLLSATIIEKRTWATTISLPDGKKLVLTKAVVVADKNICSGCRTCEAVCTNVNSFGRNSSQLARLSIAKDYIYCDYEPQTCYQCSDPACLEACPSGALQIDRANDTYARVIDEDKCIGCESCVEACERRYTIPRPRLDTARDVCIKCHLCYGDPQCVKFCPTGALRIVRSDTGILTGYPFAKEM